MKWSRDRKRLCAVSNLKLKAVHSMFFFCFYFAKIDKILFFLLFNFFFFHRPHPDEEISIRECMEENLPVFLSGEIVAHDDEGNEQEREREKRHNPEYDRASATVTNRRSIHMRSTRKIKKKEKKREREYR